MGRKKYLLIGGLIVMIAFIGSFLFYILFKTSPENPKKDYLVKLTEKIDPEIVLINIGEGDRAFIGNLLLKIDSCKPILIAIDAWFIKEKDSIQDLKLMSALRNIQNDILGYTLDTAGMPLYSHEKFKSLASNEGIATLEQVDGLACNITPIQVINNKIHENLALRIIRHWLPNFRHDIKLNQSIPINFTRTIDQYTHFDGTELNTENHCKSLKNKIILLGYLGPSNEDKFFTPIRTVKNYSNDQPDTYGLVIIANEIRTILEYKAQD